MIGTLTWIFFCTILSLICFMGSAIYFLEGSLLLGLFTFFGGILWIRLGLGNDRP